MEGWLGRVGAFFAEVGLWSGYGLWVFLMVVGCFAVLLSLPGGWIAFALAVLYDLLHGFEAIGLWRLGIFAALLGLGELVESLLGLVYVAKKGATRYGVIGGFVGGIAGAVLGSGVVPVFGTLFGSFLGAFAGAVAGEYWRDRQIEGSVRIGMHATVGRVLAQAVKFALALTGAVLCAAGAVP